MQKYKDFNKIQLTLFLKKRNVLYDAALFKHV